MLRFLNSDIVFQEVPDEVALAINLSGCPCRCPGCHSPYLWAEVGEPLTPSALDELIAPNLGKISCVALMGGDADHQAVDDLMRHLRDRYPGLHTAWYSGRSFLDTAIHLSHFDYIKLGPWLAHLGPLNNPHTNQRFYKVVDGRLVDITARFWRKN